MTPAAGYSGTPLPRKLGIKAGHLILLDAAPSTLDALLVPLPPDVTIQRRAGKGPYDVVLSFVTSQVDLQARLPAHKPRLRSNGGLWMAWPKKASGVKTDVTEDLVRNLALELGLVDNKVCAVDAVWSGLRLVYRLKDRV